MANEYIYKSFKVDQSSLDYLNSEKAVLEDFEGLSRLNIFVGSNNSGKSRFLRLLAQGSSVVDFDIADSSKERNWREYKEKLFSLKSKVGVFYRKIDERNLTLRGSPFKKINSSFDDRSSFKQSLSLFNDLRSVLDFFNLDERRKVFFDNYRQGHVDTAIISALLDVLQKEISDELNFFRRFNPKEIVFNKYYVPIARGLNNFNNAIQDPLAKHLQYFGHSLSEAATAGFNPGDFFMRQSKIITIFLMLLK